MEIDILFKESIYGAQKSIQVFKDMKCRACKGNRSMNGDSLASCQSCRGKGMKKDQLFQNLVQCKECDGHGSIPEVKCSTCHGEGILKD